MIEYNKTAGQCCSAVQRRASRSHQSADRHKGSRTPTANRSFPPLRILVISAASFHIFSACTKGIVSYSLPPVNTLWRLLTIPPPCPKNNTLSPVFAAKTPCISSCVYAILPLPRGRQFETILSINKTRDEDNAHCRARLVWRAYFFRLEVTKMEPMYVPALTGHVLPFPAHGPISTYPPFSPLAGLLPRETFLSVRRNVSCGKPTKT